MLFRSLVLRNILGKLDNRRLELIFKASLDSGLGEEIAEKGDFDFHLGSLLRLLGLKRVTRLLGSLALPDLTSILREKAKTA